MLCKALNIMQSNEMQISVFMMSAPEQRDGGLESLKKPAFLSTWHPDYIIKTELEIFDAVLSVDCGSTFDLFHIISQ